ncbi:dUTP diphosphatase [Erysipelothrix urinaevulpis]|uniref:dUTP diphosphatase n=1 Tax=Erysipelothrix urinaevulpis TaxID=2683717 RepID=UPI00135922E0|nr:dUTP diphosphatase [Erysipelothrix urinaevulpis]
MELKIDDLQKIQDQLDQRIFDLHKTSRSATREDRVLALLVELGELANETRCFKYWSLNKTINEAEMFEEFSDVLHFALSLGIDIKFNEAVIEFEKSNLSTADIFRKFYQEVIQFQQDNHKDSYRLLMITLGQLADNIGLTSETMREMYFYKNKKNHERQDNEY